MLCKTSCVAICSCPASETTFSITAEPKACFLPVRAASAHAAPTEVIEDGSGLGLSNHGEQDERQPSPDSQGLSESQLQHNAALISRLQGKLILAPLTKYVAVGSCTHAVVLLVCFIYTSGFSLLLSLTCAEVWCRGGNVPYRRLCASFGADATMSEMSYARNLNKGNVVERTHLRQAANEHCFGEHVRCII